MLLLVNYVYYFKQKKTLCCRQTPACKLTPKLSNYVTYLEHQKRYSHQSHSQTRQPKDSGYEQSSKFMKTGKYCIRIVVLSDLVLNGKQVIMVRQYMKPENNMMSKLEPHRRSFYHFFKKTKTYQTNVILLPMFLPQIF